MREAAAGDSSDGASGVEHRRVELDLPLLIRSSDHHGSIRRESTRSVRARVPLLVHEPLQAEILG